MFKKISAIIIATLAIETKIHSYYYKASCWTNGTTSLIFLNDCHCPPTGRAKEYLPLIHNQRQDLLNFLESSEKPLVIIEDLDVYTAEMAGKLDEFIANPIAYDTNTNLGFSRKDILEKLETIITPLVGFTQCCHACKIPVKNVDFRYYNLESLDKKLTIKDAHNLLSQAINCISDYNDCKQLNKLYAQTVSQIQDKLTSYKKPTGTTVITHIPFDEANLLIDLKILHHIYKNKDHSHIIVAAGGAHISRVEKRLNILGYQKKSTTRSPSYELALDLNEILPRLITTQAKSPKNLSTKTS